MHCCRSEEERALSEGERCTSDDEESKESADTHTHTLVYSTLTHCVAVVVVVFCCCAVDVRSKFFFVCFAFKIFFIAWLVKRTGCCCCCRWSC